MFGGVLNSLTRKLGQTATKSEAGKLAGLIGGEGAIAKSAPKAIPKRGFKDELEKLRGEVFDAVDNGDYMYENPDLESLVSNLGKERGFGLSYDDGWDNYVVGIADKKMPIDVASKNMSELANEYGFKITANPDGTYRLYHGTNKKAADSIKKGGFEDGRVYLSPSKDVEYGGVNGAGYYGDNILDVDVDPRDLMFNPSGEFYLEDSKLAKLAESVPEMTDQVIYHGTPNKFTKFNNDGGSTWFTSNKDKIKDSGLSWNGQGELNIMERKLPSDLKLANRELEDRYTRWELESMGYKGIKYDDIGPDEIYYELFEPNKLPLNEAVPEEAMAYLGGSAGSGNDLLKYMNATNPEFVAKKNLGAKTKTPAPRGRPTNEIRDSIAGTRIHPDDMDAMDEFIRYARNKKLRNSLPDDKQAKYEMRAYDMADHYGIKLNENATDPIRDMANRFIKAMDKQNLGGK